jgi:hypothetical protein
MYVSTSKSKLDSCSTFLRLDGACFRCRSVSAGLCSRDPDRSPPWASERRGLSVTCSYPNTYSQLSEYQYNQAAGLPQVTVTIP